MSEGKRVAVFGPSGMLGRSVRDALTEAGHTPVAMYRQMFDLLNLKNLTGVIEQAEVDAIVNCAGIIPVRSTNVIEMIDVNSKFPHILARAAAPKLVILISTDCVFSGRNRARYKVQDLKDPRDYYGQSKSLGEVVAPNVQVVRTSFIGCEHGLMNWVLQTGVIAKSTEVTQRIQGYKNALWTGSTVQAVAHSIVNDLLSSELRGVVHLSTRDSISKHDLVLKIIDMHDLDIVVEPVMQPTINRALIATVELQDAISALNEYRCTENARRSLVNV